MHGLRDEDGRWIQDEGVVDITCLSKPVVILETPLVVFTLAFYSNNEPHFNFTTYKTKSIEVMKYLWRAIGEIRSKFDELGYDKIYILVQEDDEGTKKKVDWLGFKPTIIYESSFGPRFIKYELETK